VRAAFRGTTWERRESRNCETCSALWLTQLRREGEARRAVRSRDVACGDPARRRRRGGEERTDAVPKPLGNSSALKRHTASRSSRASDSFSRLRQRDRAFVWPSRDNRGVRASDFPSDRLFDPLDESARQRRSVSPKIGLGRTETLIRALLGTRRWTRRREMRRDHVGLEPRRQGPRGGFIDLANPLPYIPNYFSLEPALSLSLSLRLGLFLLQLFVRGRAASRAHFPFSFLLLPPPASLTLTTYTGREIVRW